jgi:hypothetical protein
LVALRQEFTKATGIKFKTNGLRNSFASYLLTYEGKGAEGELRGVGRLAMELGNSESIAAKHYMETTDPGSGNRYFAIRPAGIGNVAAIAA